jgi:DNA-binding PadR family transcriptional regulator
LKKSRPRNSLGLLEASALFFICGRAHAGQDTSAADLQAEFARFETRTLRQSALYSLLAALERKSLIAHSECIDVDALGRPRPVRYYAVTEHGMRVAAAEFQTQATIVAQTRGAFAEEITGTSSGRMTAVPVDKAEWTLSELVGASREELGEATGPSGGRMARRQL